MIVLWVVVAVAVEIAAGRAVGALFAARDDFALWERECVR